MLVTSALQSLSFHRAMSSPFLMFQHNTSSLAPTIARPALEDRKVVFFELSSAAQTTLEEVDVMSPNVLECAYFLELLVPGTS